MTNKKQLEILMQGADVWNKWRDENPDAKIVLTTAKLRDANLEGANLEGANLEEANLRDALLNKANLKGTNLRTTDLVGANFTETALTGADLTEANLMKARLGGANLTNAALSYANLSHTFLEGANFMGADFTEANFTQADFVAANLRKADFTRSLMNRTILGENDLSGSLGLETVEHYGPSIISIDTIRNSKGKIPIEFLRGCGLSDLDIEYAKLANPDLAEKEIIDITYKIHELRAGGISVRYNSVFISYSFSDQDFAQRLYDDFQNNGVRCWFAPHDIQGGKKIHEQIDEAIQTYDRLLLILSENSMNSEWVKTEIANARQKEINESRQVLFPISLVDYEKIKEWKNFDADTGKDSAREIREYFIPDFSNWQDQAVYQQTFEHLLRDLKAQ